MLASAQATPARAQPPQPNELHYPLTEEARSVMRLDLRYLLRDPARARTLPLMVLLNRTIAGEVARIRFPAEALGRLTREIDAVADSLPESSPLIDLGARARAFVRAAALEPAAAAPPPPPARPAADENPSQPRSASEEAQLLRRAAAAVEVAFVTTAELDDKALAGYLNYCLTLENYAAVIESLAPRVERAPKVWTWNLLLTAMRMSAHPDFTAAAARFHAWMELAHPEAQNDVGERVDSRRFSTQKMRIIEDRELGLA
ncbi:MAG: hypothetical protein JNM90_18590 [Burkholderiales bacterium]|nr:hypothetical protein [Burkholderiales bacterium]